MTDILRWGIMGTGTIAHKMVEGLLALPDAEVEAVGSRSQATADAFAEEYGIPRRHASYEALAADPEVDVVYIASPHSCHRDNTLLALRGGKHVLCEKPFAINRREAEEMAAEARARGLFLMEAMWTRFLPAMCHTRRWLAEGQIGAPRIVYADFGFQEAYDPASRLFDPAFGGGALLDVGVYAVSFAAMVFGSAPNRITGLADLCENGADGVNAAVLGYPGGGLAVLSSAVLAETPQEARIIGPRGSILVPSPFWCSDRARLTTPEMVMEEVDVSCEGNGYTHQAREVMEGIRAGRTESDIMPLDETLEIMGTLDALRALWGVRYPME